MNDGHEPFRNCGADRLANKFLFWKVVANVCFGLKADILLIWGAPSLAPAGWMLAGSSSIKLLELAEFGGGDV